MASHENDDVPHKSVSDAQLMLFFSEMAEKYNDARVTFKGIEWKAQQSVLCTRGPFFEVCFPKETFKEGETKIVDFADDEPHAVEALLIYLYTLEYPNRNSLHFERPALKAKASAPITVEPILSAFSGRSITMPTIPSDVDEESAAEPARFKLKSELPNSSGNNVWRFIAPPTDWVSPSCAKRPYAS